MLAKVKNFIREEVALIAVVIIGAVTTLGTNLSTTFDTVATKIGGGS